MDGPPNWGATHPAAGSRRPMKEKGGRPTTWTRPPNPNWRAAWAWRPPAPTRTSTRYSPPTSRRRDRTAAGHLPLPLPQGVGRVLRLWPSRRLQGGRRGGRRLDPARGQHHLAGMVRTDEPLRRIVRRRRVRQRPHPLHLSRAKLPRGLEPNNAPASDGGELQGGELRILQRLHHPRSSPRRPVGDRQHAGTRGGVPGDHLVHRQRERGSRPGPELQRPPEHAARRLHRPGRRLAPPRPAGRRR